MSKGSFQPLELSPEWLSPITFDDLRYTSPPATLFRVSLPPSPVDCRRSSRHRESVVSFKPDSESDRDSDVIPTHLHESAAERVPVPQTPAPLRDSSSFLWYDDQEEEDQTAQLADRDGNDHDDDEDEDDDDDDATLNEQEGAEVAGEQDPSPVDPFFVKPKSQTASPKPSPAHSRASSFDCTSPWFMHFDAASLAALDNQLLQSPVDAFADMCYAQAVQMQDVSAAPGSYSWRRFSRLRPLSPFSEEEEEEEANAVHGAGVDADAEEESGCDSDSDSDSSSDSDGQLASPEQQAVNQSWAIRPRIYSPTSQRDSHHPARPRQESDGSIRFRAQVSSPTVSFSHLSNLKPLPLLPPPSPSPPNSIGSPALPDDHTLRSAAASPPPLFHPSPAVSQAQLALLFTSAPPKPSESVHFIPTPPRQGGGANGKAKPRSRSGTLRISTSTATSNSTSGGTWFQRGLAGIRAGFAAGN